MIGIIVNPNSRKNRKDPERPERLRIALGDAGSLLVTRRLEQIAPALERFRGDGRSWWVADGGDGALHWMINEAVELFGVERASRDVVYVPTRGGTIDFVASAIGLKGESDEIVSRLRKKLVRGRKPKVVEVPSLLFEGEQRTRTGVTLGFSRIGFGNSLAGYGANFFGPFYRSDTARGPVRIVVTSAKAFGAAAGRTLFPGPLRLLKPSRLRRAEHDYLRPAHAEVAIDGEVLCGANGKPIHQHTVIQCASIPLNLGGVFRVFPAAGEGWMHAQAGHVSALEMARIFPGLMTGQIVGDVLPNAYDGQARAMDIRCLRDTELSPVLDGEIFENIVTLSVRMGPTFRMAVP
ncbi:MAG: hypothetical protein EA398_15280 [Deltaproteobacteria bacterium]|nr:MAG: hypothetical protein EA398_15280 [Deltaproteobacteria bacterium]